MPEQTVRRGIAWAHCESGISKRTLQELASAGKIPGATKPAGRWLFHVEQFKRWLREGKAQCRETIDTSSGAATFGGTSVKSAVSESDEAYERLLS